MVKHTLSAAMVFLAFISGTAVPAAALTLDSAIETAAAGNEDLQKTAVAYQQAKRARDYGWNQFISVPSSLQLGLSNTHQLYPDAAGASAAGTGRGTTGTGSDWPLSAQVTLGASFRFSPDTPAQLSRLDLALRQAGEAYEKALRDLSVSVASSFYTLLASKLNIEILKTDMELKKAQYDQATANYNRGLASELDMLNAQYVYLTAGFSVDSAANKYGEDLAAFFLLIGLDASDGDEPEGAIETRLLDLPPGEELSAQYLMNHSAVKNQVNALELAKLTAAGNTGKLGPALSVSETFNVSASSQSGFKIESPVISGTFSVSVSIPLGDLLPFSQAGITRKNDKDSLALAASALESAKKNAAQDIQKKVNAVVQSAESIESSELSRRIAARTYELSEQGYRSGLVSQIELQAFNQRMVDAEKSAVTAKIAYLAAVYNLASVLNLDVTDLYELYAKSR
jgi:multidrug efflux system outer membrane protein